MRTELDLPRRGTDIRDLSKVAVGYVVVRITITRDVEYVEEICAKSNRLGLGNMELFECREIHLAVPGGALTPNGRGAKGKRRRGAISAVPLSPPAEQGMAEASVPHQLATVRLRILNGR